MAAVTLLPASLQKCLQQIVERSNQSSASITVILLSTTEGVPLGRVYSSDQPLNEDVLSAIESVWAPAPKQLPVLGLDRAHQVTAIFDHGTLIHLYLTPLVVTILCGPHANLGAVRSTTVPLLKEVLEPLCTTLVNSLKPADWHEVPAGSLYYH